LVGEDKSQLKCEITNLHCHGQITNAHDLKIAIASVWTFSSWALPDFVQLGLPWNDLFSCSNPGQSCVD
jgi:hypothetical protein